MASTQVGLPNAIYPTGWHLTWIQTSERCNVNIHVKAGPGPGASTNTSAADEYVYDMYEYHDNFISTIQQHLSQLYHT